MSISVSVLRHVQEVFQEGNQTGFKDCGKQETQQVQWSQKKKSGMFNVT